MTSAADNYQRQSTVGYTGHVPKRNEIYGLGYGDQVALIQGKDYKPSNFDVDIAQGKPNFANRNFYASPEPVNHLALTKARDNTSKGGENWVGGPTHNASPQHIPGYSGYIPKISAQNVHGKRYAETTGQVLSDNVDKGVFSTPASRFKTSSSDAHSVDQFRLLKNNTIDPCEQKDLSAAAEWHNAEFQGIEINEKRAYMDLPTPGYKGHMSPNRAPITRIHHRKDPFFNLNPLQPRLKPQNGDSQYKTLTTAMQSAAMILESPDKRRDMGLVDNSKVTLPVVGYTGHRVGHVSNNFYGRNHRDCIIQSKMVQKNLA